MFNRVVNLLNGTSYSYLNYKIWDFTLKGHLFSFRSFFIRVADNAMFDNFIMIIVNFLILGSF